ncbi:MAG: DNA repair protein RecO [Lachnospiraceae bacterium]|nr:DNA repair protein RecO [Lachnospiraceae bacterium]
MEQITLSGIVLSAMPIGEYDKRLVILTKERGKITAFARGARRQNSPYLAGSQPMTFGEFTVYQGRNAYTLTAVKVTKYFSETVKDFEKMSYGMYFLEIADYYGREGLEASDALNLLYVSMMALTNEHIPDRLVRVIYELKALVINGEYPDFFNCSNCGRSERLNFFDVKNGRLVCAECGDNIKRLVHLDDSTLYAIQYIITAKLSKLYTFSVKEEVLSEMESVITPYFVSMVDREFKSLDFI